MVLEAIFPKLFKLDREAIPDTREKNTNGTTISFKRFIKISPPSLKTYSKIKSLNPSEKELE